MQSSSAYILVINCGSSSLKFGLFEYESMNLVCDGLASSLNTKDAKLKIEHKGENPERVTGTCTGHGDAIAAIVAELHSAYKLDSTLAGVGHRVVHGGELFHDATLINGEVEDQIRECIALAPLHNPANIEGINLISHYFPSAKQVGVFDTAFHQSMPEHAYMYPLPYTLYEQLGVRRYGFHGSSHRYVASAAAEHLGKEAQEASLITAHLGNGASITAIKNGKSVDTSMGMTPLEGLMMGTRCGDIDPGLYDYLSNNGYTQEDISTILNKRSGLKGVSEHSNDMRTLIDSAQKGDHQSALAIEMFCYRLAKYIGAMMVPLRKLDALVFTGGIGENSALVRQKTLDHLEILNFECDATRNTSVNLSAPFEINTDSSHKILVIATDEEKMIAEDTKRLIG